MLKQGVCMLKQGVCMIKQGVCMLKQGVCMLKQGVCMLILCAFASMTNFNVVMMSSELYMQVSLK